MLSIVLALLMSVSVFAKNDCMKIVVNDEGTQFDEPPDSQIIDQAEQWLYNLGDYNASLEKGLLVYRSWQRWNSVTSDQRNQMLAIELKLISPGVSRPGQLVSLDGRGRLNELSALNLKRMLLQLRIRHPDIAELLQSSRFSRQADVISQTVRVVYTAPLLSRIDAQTAPPIPSPREMIRSQIFTQRTDLYSQMLSGAPSASLAVRLASGNDSAPAGLYLREDVAKADGFFMPAFEVPEEIIAFFAVWDPQALDELYIENQMSFPAKVNTGLKMIEHFKNSGVYIDQVFPPDKPEKLRVLREKLKDYVLNEQDGRTFIREAFKFYTLFLAEKKQAIYTNLSGQLYSKLSHEILRGFFDFIDFPGLTLRIPVAAKSSDYFVVRETPQVRSFQQTPYRSLSAFQGRIDHDGKK